MQEYGNMSFDKYPAPPSAPLLVSAATAGPMVEIAEHASIDPVTGRTIMVVRVVQVADDGAGAPPSIRLQVDAGAMTAVAATPTPLPAQPGGGPAAALATLGAVTDDIHVVEIELVRPGHTWHIQIANIDTSDHRYTWVVGSTHAATYQPWLNVPLPTLEFDALAGETTAAQDLPLANYGSGPLTVDDPDGADLGSGFRLVTISQRTLSGNRRGSASIAFTASNNPGSLSTTHTFASSDTDAGSVPGHNNRVALAAAVRPPWTVRGAVRRSDTLDHQGNPTYELDKSYAPLFINGSLRRSGSVTLSVLMPQFIPVQPDPKSVAVWVKVNGTEHIDLRISNWLMPSPTWRQIGPIRLEPAPFELEITSGEGDGAGWPDPTELVLAGDIRVALDP
jgi:hypothetical protein